MKPVEFLFDFGSPNAYLCHRLIPAIEARSGIRFTYVPVLLGGIFKATGNQSPMNAFAHIKNKPAYDRLEMHRFIKRHAITEFGFNPHFPVNTLAIMRGAVAAQRLGVFQRYVDEVYRYMWSDHRKMDEPAVIQEALEKSGLPTGALIAKSQEADVKQELVDTTTRAVERGAFGSPTFFVGDEIYFGKDRLWQVVEAATGAQI
mgnify:CR=1 FL=1